EACFACAKNRRTQATIGLLGARGRAARCGGKLRRRAAAQELPHQGHVVVAKVRGLRKDGLVVLGYERGHQVGEQASWRLGTDDGSAGCHVA
nr:hypothetical protein [Tanacetum cinerariifolium]